MATATRVAQDNKAETTPTLTRVQVDIVTTRDGKEVERVRDSAWLEPGVKTVYTPQPDRIRLNLSLEEADYLRWRLVGMTGADAWSIANALASTLSPHAGTQASPLGGGACGGGSVDPNPKGLLNRY